MGVLAYFWMVNRLTIFASKNISSNLLQLKLRSQSVVSLVDTVSNIPRDVNYCSQRYVVYCSKAFQVGLRCVSPGCCQKWSDDCPDDSLDTGFSTSTDDRVGSW